MAISTFTRGSFWICDASLQNQITIPTAVTINAKKNPINACLDPRISLVCFIVVLKQVKSIRYRLSIFSTARRCTDTYNRFRNNTKYRKESVLMHYLKLRNASQFKNKVRDLVGQGNR